MGKIVSSKSSILLIIRAWGGGCDENRNNDAVIDGCCLSIYSASMHLEFISQNRLSLKKAGKSKSKS